MPQYYAVLDNGQGSGGKKPRSAKVRHVRQYLKKKGVAPTRDAASRSTRERKLRAKARAEFAAKGKKSSSSSTRRVSTSHVADREDEKRKQRFPQGPPKGIGKGY